MGKPANYEILEAHSSEAILVIRDIGPWDVHFTVSNDAEAVVEELISKGYLYEGRRLIYYDSAGNLDEIIITDRAFGGFVVYRKAKE